MEHLAPDDLVDDASELSAESLASGSRLGRYELLLAIAYGGMARVWAARQLGQRGFSKTVAIKTILPHLAHSPEFERMFLDEARIAAGVHHPNVTEIYELGEEGKVLYLAMEWVNGDSLAHVLRPPGAAAPQPIDARVAARIVADACAGLHAAHELCDDSGRLLNVVHRDVSPHNILLNLDGTVKVTDFGVARALGQTHQATVAGQVKGKVAYMAPEQIGGTPFDRRADIFGMGCLLYEATTGLRPFRGEGDPQVMQAVLRGTYDPPGRIVSGYPNELASILDRALAPEPRARFATAERMRVALEEWIARSGVVTGTQVGSLVRARLGAVVDRRRDQIRAATQALHGPEPTSNAGAAGHTPASGSRSGQSHSGVVTMGLPPPRARALSAPPPLSGRVPGQPPPPVPPPPLPRPAASLPPHPPPAPRAIPQTAPAFVPQPVPGFGAPPPPLPLPARPAPSRARYVLAAVGGVTAAVALGCMTLAGWSMLRAGSAVPSGTSATVTAAVPESTAAQSPAASATATGAPAAATAAFAPASASAPPEAPPAAPEAVAAPAAVEPPTTSVTDLPVATTVAPAAAPPPAAPPPAAYRPPPPAAALAPARPAAPSRPAALPANPY